MIGDQQLDESWTTNQRIPATIT